MCAARKVVGLPSAGCILITCFLAGAAAGLAGMVEVAAVHGRANANLAAGYGYAGILVAFIARHNPVAVIPVATLLGGIWPAGAFCSTAQACPMQRFWYFKAWSFSSVL